VPECRLECWHLHCLKDDRPPPDEEGCRHLCWTRCELWLEQGFDCYLKRGRPHSLLEGWGFDSVGELPQALWQPRNNGSYMRW
jgi:hypothetical protein